MKVTIVVGLPASGKSHYIESVKHEYDIVCDDEDEKFSKLIDRGINKNIIATSPFFCERHCLENVLTRLRIIDKIVPEIVYFENNVEQCIENSLHREGKPVHGLIRYLGKVYNPPRVDRKVWKNEP